VLVEGVLADIEERIRETFPENSEQMVRIAKCESGARQFKDNGELVIGPTSDYGVFQNHEQHRSLWEKLGLDVEGSAKDNITFARYLYDHGGIAHWYSSANCWK
jgi:hypothetical protein